MRVFIACEESGVMRRAFAARGHFAVSCDLLPARDGRNASYSWQRGVEMGAGKSGNVHIVGDVFDTLDWFKECHINFDLLIAHPPCTYLTRAGWHWVNKPDQDFHPYKGEPRRRMAREGAAFFRRLLEYPHIPRRAVENPRPIVHAGLPAATQYLQPWMFGDWEVKETGFWLHGLPQLAPDFPTLDTARIALDKAADDFPTARIWRMAPGPDRAKMRSETFPGIANACAEQWGSL